MKIRAVTVFANPGYPLDPQIVSKTGYIARKLNSRLGDAGYEVQSTRLAITPFGNIIPSVTQETLLEYSSKLSTLAYDNEFMYLSMGPVSVDSPDHLRYVPSVVEELDNIFFSANIINNVGDLSMASVAACADCIVNLKDIKDDGFGNLFFSVLANVPAGVPFFPAAYHVGSGISVAIATESADLVNTALDNAENLSEFSKHLTNLIEENAESISSVVDEICSDYACNFGGIDFTFAPYPGKGSSIGQAIESLGVSTIGDHGSVAAISLLTSILQGAKFNKAGFNGLFFPILEDSILAKRASGRDLTINDLLLYSTVCGTGLDTVPIPGDISKNDISAILMDIGTLSSRLRKPLTARLMPIPGKSEGDPIAFDFEYFAPSSVIGVRSGMIHGKLGNAEAIPLKPQGDSI